MPLTLDSPRHREGRTPGHAGLAAVPPDAPAATEPVAALMLRLTGVDITRCPVCQQATCVSNGTRSEPGTLPIPTLDSA